MSTGFQSFEFDLPGALLTHLTALFDSMESASLTQANVQELPDAQGVYQLTYEGNIVYVGKTDGEAGLRKRLDRHAWSIQHRSNLEAEHVAFKAIRVYVFTAIDLETQLRRHYSHGHGLPWDKSGFGSNDPGRERDTTKLKAGGFDALYPVDLDRPLGISVTFPITAALLLSQLKEAVPYGIRAQSRHGNKRKSHTDLDVAVTAITGDYTARNIVISVVASLPAGWQATLLPGRIILYHENKDYSAGTVIARSE